MYRNFSEISKVIVHSDLVTTTVMIMHCVIAKLVRRVVTILKAERQWSLLTFPSTKPSRRKRMTEKMERMQGTVTPSSMLSLCLLAVVCSCVCVCVCVLGVWMSCRCVMCTCMSCVYTFTGVFVFVIIMAI